MSATPFYCRQPNRLEAVRAQSRLNGIEYLEVASADQRTLRVVFVHPLRGGGVAGAVPASGASLTELNFRIEGGVRIRGLRVTAVTLAGREALLSVNAAGDFSTYTLRLVASDLTDTPPAGYDPLLAAVDFNFKAACPSEFDCRDDRVCPPPVLAEPALDYLAKDYASFRRLMLDRLRTLMPEWRDHSPADPLITLVEALAAQADRLSYWQDAIATEAYLGTARRRTSVRRHTRLLDYSLHDGCNARTWVHLAVSAAATLDAGTPVLTSGGDGRTVLDSAAYDAALRAGATVFLTLHDAPLDPAHNEIGFYTWSGTQCCLPRGATRATLQNSSALSLAAGDWLLLEETVSPTTGLTADVDRTHRHIVRLTRATPGTDPLDDAPILEVEWSPADALPFPFCVSAQLAPTAPPFAVGVARGNLVLADHGVWRRGERLTLEPAAADRPPRARLAERGLTVAAPFALEGLTAAAALDTAPEKAVPVVELISPDARWRTRRGLLGSDRFAPEFAVEIEEDGSAAVRFGDGVHGRRPPGNAPLIADYRLGSGPAGNVGADTLTRIHSIVTSIRAVRNPLAARGGVAPELLESARQHAPEAFRRQERAVTTADWIEVAERHPGVQRAAAQFRWTGSWHTVFVTIDRRGGRPVDAGFELDLRRHLERFRLAGYDLEIDGPAFVPLDVKIRVCVQPGYFRADVKRALLEVFSAGVRADGTTGFFHPDRLTFGQPVYLSAIVAAAMAVAGVRYVEVLALHRYGKLPAGELAAGVVRVSPFEILRCDSDPNFRENGRIEFEMEGGL